MPDASVHTGGLFRILYQGQLLAAQALLYTAPKPPNTRVEISAIWICNTDSAVRACTLRVGRGILTAANSLLDAAPIEPNHTYIVFAHRAGTLVAGESFAGYCDVAGKMTVTIFGHEWQ